MLNDYKEYTAPIHKYTELIFPLLKNSLIDPISLSPLRQPQ